TPTCRADARDSCKSPVDPQSKERFMKRITAIGLVVFALSCAALAAAALSQTPAKSAAQFYALRLEPGQDLRQELQTFAKAQKLRAAFIASCSGSVTCTAVRYANQNSTAIQQGHFE